MRTTMYPLNAEQKRACALWVTWGKGENEREGCCVKERLHKWASRQRLLGNRGLESNAEATGASGLPRMCC